MPHTRVLPCDDCHGSGTDLTNPNPAEPLPCPTCFGSGDSVETPSINQISLDAVAAEVAAAVVGQIASPTTEPTQECTHARLRAALLILADDLGSAVADPEASEYHRGQASANHAAAARLRAVLAEGH